MDDEVFAILLPNGRLWGFRYSHESAAEECAALDRRGGPGHCCKRLVPSEAIESLTAEIEQKQKVVDAAIAITIEANREPGNDMDYMQAEEDLKEAVGWYIKRRETTKGSDDLRQPSPIRNVQTFTTANPTDDCDSGVYGIPKQCRCGSDLIVTCIDCGTSYGPLPEQGNAPDGAD